MIAIEVWINGEKKCVAGTNGNILSAIVHAARHSHIHVCGLMEKNESTVHVDWPPNALSVGDEVTIKLIATDEVDSPRFGERSLTQAERDNEVQSHLWEAHSMLPANVSEENDEALALFKERMEQKNFVVAMQILGELGQQTEVPASYWNHLGHVAYAFSRYEQGSEYHKRETALTPKDENTQ